MVDASPTINASLYEKLTFNFVRDAAPVATVARVPFILVVNPSVPAKTLTEFIAYAKANPGKINYGSAGRGSTLQVAAELFKMLAGVDLVHVPYKGGAPAITDAIGGQVQAVFIPAPAGIDTSEAGNCAHSVYLVSIGFGHCRMCLPSARSYLSTRRPRGMGWLRHATPLRQLFRFSTKRSMRD